jgi:hypothetical protein
MTLDEIRKHLIKYVPDAAVDYCLDLIARYRFALCISRSRHSKYGDYRPPEKGQGHRITINHDLNQYAFLITFIHEVAHLTTFVKTKSLRPPHGPVWKKEFQRLLYPLLYRHVFPSDLLAPLQNYIANPAATSCTDLSLLRALKKYNSDHEHWQHLEDLPAGVIFRIKTGRVFIKKHQARKNFLCMEVKTNQPYMLNPLMEAQPLVPSLSGLT